MIFTSISPNTESDDVALAWKLLWRPWAWKKGPAPAELEREFKKKFSFSSAYAFQSGRNALYAILKTLALKADDEVLLQAYTCVAVPEPVLWVGAKPVYVDVDETLTMSVADLPKKITPKAKVLIIQHTFGVPARVDELLAIARRHDIFVIEDCAHAVAPAYKGKPVGSFGDAAFFSFGRDKVLSSVFGGVAVAGDTELAGKYNLTKKIPQIRDTFSYPSLFSIKRQLWHPIIMTFAKKTYVSGVGKAMIEILKRIGLIPKAVENRELSGGKPSFFGQKMPNAMATLALNQFKKLDRYNEHRTKIALLYREKLNVGRIASPGAIPAQASVLETSPIPLRYTIFVDDPRAVFKEAKRRNIELGDWYRQSIAPKNVAYDRISYDPVTCPIAEKFAQRSVNLPTHIGISEADAEEVITCVNIVPRSS